MKLQLNCIFSLTRNRIVVNCVYTIINSEPSADAIAAVIILNRVNSLYHLSSNFFSRNLN